MRRRPLRVWYVVLVLGCSICVRAQVEEETPDDPPTTTAPANEAMDRGPAGTDNRAAAQRLFWLIDHRYSHRNLRHVNWESLYKIFGPRLERAKSPMEFARTAVDLLNHAQDPHIWVTADNVTLKAHRYLKKTSPNFNMRTLSRVVPGWQRKNLVVYTGRFADGIGYIMIRSWSLPVKPQLEAVFEALKSFQDAKGVILDIRPNGGGADRLAKSVAGCFVDQRVVFSKYLDCTPDPNWESAAPKPRAFRPSQGRPAYRGNVAVLMGPKCVSASDGFLLMMKQVPQCKLIGENSYGASARTRPHDLGNGVTVSLPSWKALRMDGTCFEGQGIAPDIRIKTSLADFKRRDPVLEAALKYLRSNAPSHGRRESETGQVPLH